jgi:hypothetical protein
MIFIRLLPKLRAILCERVWRGSNINTRGSFYISEEVIIVDVDAIDYSDNSLKRNHWKP